MNHFVIMPKMKKILILAALSLIFVVLGIVLLFISFSVKAEETAWLTLVSILTIVIFGLCFIYYLKVFIKREPAVIISTEGIVDQSSFIGAGLVKWDEIKEIQFVSFSGQIYLGISTFDRELIINRMTGIKKLFNQVNKGLMETQVNIPVKILACSMDEMLKVINEYWEWAMQERNSKI